MARNDNENYILGQAVGILQNKKLEDLSQKDIAELSQAIKLYLAYCETATGSQPDHRINVYTDLYEPGINLLPELSAILSWKPEEKEKEEKVTPPKKEEVSVPAELEELVAIYKESQADKLEADETHSVADSIKRARKAWNVIHERELIKENRLKQIEDDKERQKQIDAEDDAYENFVISTVNPKAKSSREIYQNLTLAIEEAVRYQDPRLNDDEVDQAVYNLTRLSLSGAIDINNPQDFYIATHFAIKEAGGSIDKNLDQIDELEKSRLKALETDRYSDKPDDIQNQINLADEAISQKIKDASLNFPDKIQEQYQDFDSHFPEAKKQNAGIQRAYLNALPDAKLPTAGLSVLQQQAATLEAEIRDKIPDALKINPDTVAAKYIGLIQTTVSANRNISPEALRFLGLGLTKEKLDAAQNDKNSVLGQLYHSDKYGAAFKELHYRVRKIHESTVGKEVEKGLRPVTGVDKYFNSLNPAAQSAMRLVLDPRGTVTSWASRQSGRLLGQSLINQTGSAAAKKLGGFLLEDGLQAGVKKFTTQAVGKLAVKAAVWVTARLGWSALSESLNAIIPGGGVILDIIGQIVIWIGEKTLGAIGSQLNELHRAWTGHDFSLKEASVPIIAGGVTLAGLAATSIAGFIAIRRATQIAVVSAVGIIIASVATLLFYVSFSYLVAPVLSTLVQFDSVEKVKYEDYTYISASGDCGWPTSGHYSIVTGPTGGTHYKSKLEAIDIGAPNLSPHLSGTDGVVSFTGVYSNYGNTVVVSTTNDAGSFDVYYGHLAVISVGKGQQVKKGQKIGVVGGSGGWSPHIHMEYKGIKYNECPAGGLQIKVGCCSYSPAPQCTGACNAFSN